jgi:hypothetical protein
METQECHPNVESSKRKKWSRQQVAEKLTNFVMVSSALGMSQHEYARRASVSRTTLRWWLQRQASIDALPATVRFFESPEGQELLHRIIVAAQFVITLLGAGGIRLVCTFLELSGLDRFVASSYGVQQQQIAAMESEVSAFGNEQRRKLAATMRRKAITVCQDETFHPQICLVGLEPASGFILLEQYADKRDAGTWTEAMVEATEDLSVEIVQSTGDEAAALIKHAEVDQGAHHSPDLFHVQYEVSKGTSNSMARHVRAAQKVVEEKTQHIERMKESANYFDSTSKQGCCTPAFIDKALADAKKDEATARKELEQAEERQKEMRQSVRGLSKSYHPYDLATGAARSADVVDKELDGHFAQIDALADEISLGQRCRDHIEKARRVLVRMVATITFFHATVTERVEALGLPEKIETVLRERWIPGRYLELVASRASGAERRAELRVKAAEVGLSPIERAVLLAELDDEERELVEQVAEDCAQLFQRSSSPVEGRNGHLDLFHHGHHRLSSRKLRALTTVHNYFKRRPDGATAAERFFEAKHADLFESLLERLKPLPRPASRRRRVSV